MTYNPDANIFLFVIPKVVKPEKLWRNKIVIADCDGETGHVPEQTYQTTEDAWRALNYPECSRCGKSLKPKQDNLPYKIGIPQDSELDGGNIYGDVSSQRIADFDKYCWECKKHIEKKKLTAKKL